jgi:hypothetical protein
MGRNSGHAMVTDTSRKWRAMIIVYIWLELLVHAHIR